MLYPSLLVTGLVILSGLLWGKIKKKRFVLWAILVEYLLVVICSTIICRSSVTSGLEKLQLAPLWTYKSIIEHTSGVSVWDIILNIVLFIPLGLLVKLIYPKLSVHRIMMVASLFSLFIETNQYFWGKGIAQIDDVLHNVLGAIIGFGIAWIIKKVCSTLS